MSSSTFEPAQDAESEPFWSALAEGTLLLRRCGACGRSHWYPRPHCPRCHADGTEWQEASGAGTLYSWTVIRRTGEARLRDQVPYVIGLVDLAEGARVVGFVDADPEALRADLAVVLDLEDRPDRAAIRFRPAPAG